MSNITRAVAIKLSKSKFWEGMTHEQIARFQLYTELLCMPFDVYHEAVEKALGRPVWTHEFVAPEKLKAELDGDIGPPTMDEIIGLIPKEKRIVLRPPKESEE